MAELAKQFVCVRIQSMNGVNIHLFQFERDLTWMSFFMDAENRFYTRFGGREDGDAESHLTQASLVSTMKKVLALHRDKAVQQSRYEPSSAPARTPEQIPTMKPMMAKRRENQCIHCHDVKVAELRHLQQTGQFKRELVFTYPAPSGIGLELDPDRQNLIRSVRPNSPAAEADIRSGDQLLEANGQRILTFGDFTRVLELTPGEAKLPLTLRRGDKTQTVTLTLNGSWRRTEDPSWRESLHVAGPNGGFWGRKLSAAEREKAGLPKDKMAVLVTFIWGDHTRRAGLQNEDIITAFDGMTRDLSIAQLHARLNLDRNYGDTIPLTVRRKGEERKLALELPKTAPAE